MRASCRGDIPAHVRLSAGSRGVVPLGSAPLGPFLGLALALRACGPRDLSQLAPVSGTCSPPHARQVSPGDSSLHVDPGNEDPKITTIHEMERTRRSESGDREGRFDAFPRHVLWLGPPRRPCPTPPPAGHSRPPLGRAQLAAAQDQGLKGIYSFE